MKKKSSVSLGPGASSLILIFVVLALSVLGMLSLMNSRTDLALSERSAQVAEAAYSLMVKTEEKYAALDELLVQAASGAADEEAYLAAVAEALPDDVNLYDREIAWLEVDSWEGANGTLRQIDCALELKPLGEAKRAEWIRHSLSAVTEETIKALIARAEQKRLALEAILAEAGRNAADQAQALSAVQNALPGGMTLSDGVVSFVETSAGTETDGLLQLHCQLAIQPLDGETKCVWVQRSVTDVTDEGALAIIEQADGTLADLTEGFALALQEAVATDWKTIEEADALFLRLVQDRLPEDVAMDGRTLAWTEIGDGLALYCAVEIQPLGSNPLVLWIGHTLARGDAPAD